MNRPTRLGLILGVGIALLGNSGPLRADLVFSKTAIDVGEIKGGMPVPQRFAFVNKGQETLEITGLHVSCGCLKPKLEKKVYKAGEKGELLLEINPLSQSAGKHAWTAQVAYRVAGELKEETLRITGAILAEVAVQPAALTVFPEHARQHTITLTDIREKPLSITDLKTSSTRLHARASEPRKNDRGHWVQTIRLEADADFPEGKHEEELTIASSDPDYRFMRVPVTVVKRAKKHISAVPDPIYLQGASNRLVVLRDDQDQPIEIDFVEAEDPALVCQWSKGQNTAATVKVHRDPKAKTDSKLKSAIHVHISKPTATTLTIPVIASKP